MISRRRWSLPIVLASLAACGGSQGGTAAELDARAPDVAELDTQGSSAGRDAEGGDDSAAADLDAPDAPDAPDAGALTCPRQAVDVSGLSVEARGRYRVLADMPISGLSSRDVTVWLPQSYGASPERRYPVLYLHDGQNLFDAERAAFGVEWGVDEVVTALVAAGVIDELIVVGVDNSAERLSDYSPTEDPDYGGGQAERYLSWLSGTLKPIIDTLYRTRCERSATGIAGSSMGGLVSLYAALAFSETFGRVGVISPSLWWDGGALLDELDGWEGRLPERLWIDIGTAEGGGAAPVPDTVRAVRRARDRALALGMILGDDLGYLEDPGAEHNEAAWRARLPVILRFLFGDAPLEAPDSLRLGFFSGTLELDSSTSAVVEAERQPFVRYTLPNAEVTFEAAGDAARVSADGVVSAEAVGDSLVTASWGELSASATVSVVGAPVETDFIVDVPPSTPPGDSVFLAGDRSSLGAWDAAGVLLTQIDATRWAVTLSLPEGAQIAYKFTRGTWATVESDGDAGDIDNRVYGPAAQETVTHTVLGWMN